jgi:alpha-mannosidase
VEDVPGYGVRPLPIGDASAESSGDPALPVEPVRADARSLDNGTLRVTVDDGGVIHLESRRHGRSWTPLIRFEDVGDAGDLYTHSAIEPTVRDARLVDVRLTHGGPLRGEIRARVALDLPRSSGRDGRSREVARNEIELALTLDAGAGFVRVAVRGVNRARDHRLRIVFATGVSDGITTADAMFGPVTRLIFVQPPETRSMEVIPATAPLGRWVSRRTATHGMTLISDGLGEYEVMGNGAIAVTLLRAVGALSRNDLPERPGHAGWPVPTPAAQTIGPYRAEFALLPHGPGDAEIADIERAADDVLVPLQGTTLRSATRPLESVRGVSLEGDGLRFLACKVSEDGEWTVLRCVNVTNSAVRGSWHCSWPVRDARTSRLDEMTGPVVPVRDGGTVEIVVEPRAIATVLVR